MKKTLMTSVLALLAACNSDSGKETVSSDFPSFETSEPSEDLSAGSASVRRFDKEAFSQASANMTTSRKGLNFNRGNRFFTDNWDVAGGAAGRDGLGPAFNVASCQACHLKDGRGHAPLDASDSADSLLLRLSIPYADATDAQRADFDNGFIAAIGHAVYGGQLQDKAVALGSDSGLKEGRVVINYQDVTVTFQDGFTKTLRKPTFTIDDLQYGELGENIQISPRVAQPMIGLGMLEAIPEAMILAKEDINDADNDGISGKANRVKDAETGQPGVLGRFGWKAINPTVAQQDAGALNGDIGITSHLFPSDNCTEVQTQAPYTQCTQAQSGSFLGDGMEVSKDILANIDFYSRNLAVPIRRDVDDPEVLAGKKLFYETGCTGCHTPKYQLPELTLVDGLNNFAEQSGQLIWPYTDMLLHDMGEDLADNHQEFLAKGNEWRTPPLWGVGLTKVVSSQATFLHDGRARDLMEAVLWHGGEAEAAKRKVLTFDETERAALMRFLQSL